MNLALPEAEGTLLIEVDGHPDAINEEINLISNICREEGAVSVVCSNDPREREKLWAGRKAAILKGEKCCGGGAGVFRTAFANLALTFGKTRVEEAKKVGAEVILTSCPMCMLNLSQAARRAQVKIEVSDTILLLAKTLK